MQSADWFVSWWHSDKLRSRLQGREPRRRFASVIILPWPDSHLPFLLLLNLILLNLLLLLLLLLFHPLSSRPSHPSPHHTSWAAQSTNSLPCPYPRFEQQSSVPSTSLWDLVHDDHVSGEFLNFVQWNLVLNVYRCKLFIGIIHDSWSISLRGFSRQPPRRQT